MTKTTNRILSLVMTVLMVLSMLSVFVIPASAAVADDYDALFNGENTYFINKAWTDAQLSGTADLTTVFNGKTVTVNPETHKLFNDFEDAYDVAYADGKVTVENYFTYIPTFAFGPGDYTSIKEIHIPTMANVLGAYAGVSPNADVSKENRTLEYVQTNEGWAKNSARVDANETKLGRISFTTRMVVGTGNSDGMYNQEGTVNGVVPEAYAKWNYLLDAALKANPDKKLTYIVDGITQSGLITITTLDRGRKYSYGGTTYTTNNTDRVCDINVLNTIGDITSGYINAWNTTWYNQSFTYENFRREGNISAFGERFIDTLTIKDSYLSGLTSNGGLFESWVSETTSVRRNTGTLNIEDSILYGTHTAVNGSSMPFYLNSDNFHDDFKTFNFNISGSVLYNFGNAKWGYIRIDNREGRNINFKVTDNIIYQDKSNNTLFNGNPSYITSGKTTIKFNGNRVIGALAAIPPNTGYTVLDTVSDTATTYGINTLMDYDFSGNYWSGQDKTASDIGIMMTFGASGAPNSKNGTLADSEWGWDWTDSDYYYDFDMDYHHYGTAVAKIDSGSNTATIGKNSIIAHISDLTQKLTPASFILNDTDSETTVKISTTQTFSDEVTEIDLATAKDGDIYYVQTSYDNTTYNSLSTKTYKLVLSKTAEVLDFKAELEAGNVKVGDNVLDKDKTVVMLPPNASTYTEKGSTYYMAPFAGKYYRFRLDNDIVYPYSTTNTYSYTLISGNTSTHVGINLKQFEQKCTDGNIILLDGTYTSQLIFSFPVNVYGTNAGIDPNDKTNMSAENNYKVELSEKWLSKHETKFTSSQTMRVMADIDGTVTVDGIVVCSRLWDDWRCGKTGTFNFVFRNVVIEKAGGQYALFNINNPRARNGNDSAATLMDEEFGETFADSFTLKNCYVRTLGENVLFNEAIGAKLTIDNLYCDITAAGKGYDVISFMKTGIYNKNVDISVTNSVITNGKNGQPAFQFQGFEKHPAVMIDDTYNYNVKFNNNIVFNTGSASSQGVLFVASGHMSSFEVKDNIIVNTTDNSLEFIKQIPSYTTAEDNELAGNITISGNRLVGFTAAEAECDLGMGKNNPVLDNTFLTADKTAHKNPTATVGSYVSSMGDSEFYLDFGMKAPASEFFIESFDVGASPATLPVYDNKNGVISFVLDRGTSEGMALTTVDGVDTAYLATDAAGTNKIDYINSNDVVAPYTTYYYIVEKTIDGVLYKRAYTVNVSPYEIKDFADIEFDNGYFTNEAVIVTDEAVGKATGDVIIEAWDGVYYNFVVGVNAYATFDEAKANDAETVEMLLTHYEGNANDDLQITRSMKVFTPNYNVNPVVSDGYGLDSPTQGKGWGYNTKYDENKDKVKIKTVSIQAGAIGVVEIYGVTIERQILDNYRRLNTVDADGNVTTDNGIKLKVVNCLFTLSRFDGNQQYIFMNLKSATRTHGYIQPESTSTMLVKDCYFAENTSEYNTRLMGEHIPAHTTFDGIYLDYAASNIEAMYLKRAANDMSLTIKNSYLANGGTSDQQFQGYMYDLTGDNKIDSSDSAENQAIKDGWKNVLTYENNILDGYYGKKSGNTTALIMICAAGYTGINFNDNYVVRNASSTSLQMFWSIGTVAANTAAKPDVNITGNVFNGLNNTIISFNQYQEGTYYVMSDANYNITGNFVSRSIVSNVYADDVVGEEYSIGYEDQHKYVTYDYYYLDAEKTLRSCDIQEYSFTNKATVNGTSIMLDVYESDGIVTTPADPTTEAYKFDFSKLIKTNKYGNKISVSYNNGTPVLLGTPLEVNLGTELIDGFGVPFTFIVDSPDTRCTEEEIYTVMMIYHKGNAPAFDGNFTDDDGVILDSAVIITPDASGKTEGEIINSEWDGETYSFTVGTNAYATVEDALADAKTANNTALQILLPASEDKTLDITVDWPCKIYGANYNVSPYTQDGYGIESASHGKNWSVNTDYTANQSHLDTITVSADFAGTFEVHGVTVHGYLEDIQRTTTVANIKFYNTLVDCDGTSRTTGENRKYRFSLKNTSNLNVIGNSFEMYNTYIKSLGTGNMAWIYGEYGPETVKFDGLFVDATAASMKSNAFLKSMNAVDGANAQIIFNNANFRNSTSGTRIMFTGSNSNYDKIKFTVTNTIFDNYSNNAITDETSYNKGEYLFYVDLGRVEEVTVENSYFDQADKVMWFEGWNSSGQMDTASATLSFRKNVFNGLTEEVMLLSPSGKWPAEDAITVNLEGNYILHEYNSAIESAGLTGESLVLGDKNIELGHAGNNYFALDYKRTVMSNVLYDYTVSDVDNTLVDTDSKTVTYAYDDSVTISDSGNITADLSGLVEVHKNNKVKVILSDGTEYDVSEVFTYDSNTLGKTVTVRVTSYDGTVYEDWAVTFAQPAHDVEGVTEVVHDANANCQHGVIYRTYCKGTNCTIGGPDCDGYTERDDGNLGDHVYDAGVYQNNATCQADGTNIHTCELCENKDERTAAGTKLTYHVWEQSAYKYNNDTTCVTNGSETAACKWCPVTNTRTTDDSGNVLYPADGVSHVWGEYTYNGDATCYANGTKTASCTENCGTEPNTIEAEGTKRTHSLTTELVYNNDATCQADGTKSYNCTHVNKDGSVCDYSEGTVTAEGTKLAHDLSNYVYDGNANCQTDGTMTATCPGVGPGCDSCTASDTVADPAHTAALTDCEYEDYYYDLGTTTCTTNGTETSICKWEDLGCDSENTRSVDDAGNVLYPADGVTHVLSKYVYQNDESCCQNGTEKAICKEGCGYSVSREVTGTMTNSHVLGEYVANKDATCEEDGTKTAKCTAVDRNGKACTYTSTVTNAADPAARVAHTWGEYTYNNDATCYKDGTKTAVCSVCGATDIEKDKDHLKATVAHNWSEWKFNKDATCKADGTESRECLTDRCYVTETRTKSGSKLAHTYGEYVYNNDATNIKDGTKTATCKACGDKNTVTAVGTKLDGSVMIDSSKKFIDVPEKSWYKKAVDYAVSYGFISGITDNTFEPDTVITRGMFVTILARMAGVDTSKEANKAATTKFTDVKSGKYYTAAIAWANANGVVAGTSLTTYEPDKNISRQQLAVMIVNFAKYKGIALTEKNAAVTFADASSIRKYAKEEVAICQKAGIISGYVEGGKVYFKPEKTATRAEATQMIYKFHSENVK